MALPPGVPTNSLVLMLATTPSPLAWNTIANLGDFTGPGFTSTVVDVSKHGDTFRRKLKTMADAGVLTFPTWFDPSLPGHAGNAQALGEMAANIGTQFTFLLTFVDSSGNIVPASAANNGPQMTFNGYVTKFALKEPVAGVYTSDTEITIDGKPTFLWQATVMPAGQHFDPVPGV